MKCKKHPTYKGLRKPRVACEDCWIIYFGISETCRNCGCQEHGYSSIRVGENDSNESTD